MKANTSFYSVHGVSLAVWANSTAVRSLIDRNYRCFRDEQRPASANLHVTLRLGESIPPAPNATQRGHGIWTEPGMAQMELIPGLRAELRASKKEEPWLVTAAFRPPRLRAVARRLVRGAAATRSDMLSLMRHAVHYPVFLRQQLCKGRSALHAAAVHSNGRAVLICGPNGAGKSTLALILVRRFGFHYLSDNFAITDGETIYGFPEQWRVPPAATGLLDRSTITMPRTHGKLHFDPTRYMTALKAHPGLLLFPEIAPVSPTSAAAMPVELGALAAQSRLDAIHFAVLESPEFSMYAIATDFLFGHIPIGVASGVHAKLVTKAPAASLAVPRNTSPREYDRLLAPLVSRYFAS